MKSELLLNIKKTEYRYYLNTILKLIDYTKLFLYLTATPN